MKTIFATTTAAAMFTLSIASVAHAGNAGASLGDCYNHVISACNQTNHPIECSESGMDACDEHHASAAVGPIDRIKLLRLPGNYYRVIFNPISTTAEQDDDDQGRGDGGRGGASRGDRPSR